MPSKHARCSASAAYRWINCPGSVALSDQCQDPGSSNYADEGTLAHAVAELKIRHEIGELTDLEYQEQRIAPQENAYYGARARMASERNRKNKMSC